VIEHPKSSPEPASAKEPIVFVIDDDASMRRALTNLFQSVGLGVQVFGSAAEMLQSKLPEVASCLVLDIRLPGLSGLDAQNEGKYPPAEPGALGIGPLEAAVRIADAILHLLAT